MTKTYTEADIRRVMADELASFDASQRRWEGLLAICEPGAGRDAIARSIARLALMIEQYPSRVAACRPTSAPELKAAFEAESRLVAAEITATLLMLQAITAADEPKT